MKRYKEANEGIHAPEEVKERAARAAGKRPHTKWMGAVAAVLAVALIGGIALWPGRAGGPTAEGGPEDGISPRFGDSRSGGGPEDVIETCGGGAPLSYEPHALALAVWPEMHPYPQDEDYFSDLGDDKDAWQKANDAFSEALDAWWEDRQALRSQTDYRGVMDQFFTTSTAQFLSGAGAENRVYSPLNVYMALSMLAEITDGDSRQQLLDLLQVESIEALRQRAFDLWRDNYQDDGSTTSLLANSLWLRDGMTYSQETLDRLAADYYASSFSGEMGSEEYDQALRDWLNEQTRGLLAEQAGGLSMDPDTVLALASTIYFKAAWSDQFSESLTDTDTFHAPDRDVDAEFMRQTLQGTYYWGEHFGAVLLNLRENSTMWLILPDEGYSVDELLESGEAMEFLLASKYDWDEEAQAYVGAWPGQKFLSIHLSMPKFDVSSDLDLIEGLIELGVTDVFDAGVSDFGPLGASTDAPLCVSQAKHAARVKVDEEGCEAAAYTVMMIAEGMAMPPDEEVDFTLDRPFFFAITGGWSALPLFTGVVNQP